MYCLSYWRFFSSSGLRIVPPLAGVPLLRIFPGAARSSPSCCVFQKVGESAILPRLTATDGITSKQRPCALLVPLSTTAAPKAASHSHLPIFSFICLYIRLCCFIFIFAVRILSISLSNAHTSRPLLRIALSPKPISIRPRYWLVGSSCCYQPRAAPRHRHLRTFAPAQRPTNLWLQRGSGCLLRASICEK